MSMLGGFKGVRGLRNPIDSVPSERPQWAGSESVSHTRSIGRAEVDDRTAELSLAGHTRPQIAPSVESPLGS